MKRNIMLYLCGIGVLIDLTQSSASANAAILKVENADVALSIEQGGKVHQVAIVRVAEHQARLALKDGQANLVSEVVANGSVLTQLLAKAPDGKSYWRQTLLSGQYSPQGQFSANGNGSAAGNENQSFSLAHPSPAQAVLQASGVLSEEAQMLLLGYDPAVLFKKQGRLINASKLDKLTLGKEPCTVQTLIVRDDPLPPGMPEPVNYASPRQRITITRAVKDGFLRQLVSVREGAQSKAETTTLTVTRISHPASIPPGRFVFTPPPGAIRVGAPTPQTPKTAPALPPTALKVEGESQYDLGKVAFRDTPKLTRTFTVKNTGEKPLALTQPRPTCPCLSGRYIDPAGKKADTLTLAPGQSAKVEATIDFTGLRSGPLTKSLLLYSADGSANAMVTLTADLLMPVAFEPALLDFSQARSGSAMTTTLTATLDARLLKAGEPTLVADAGTSLQITPVTPLPAAVGNSVQRSWRVTVPPDAPLGLVRSTLTLKPPIGASTAEAAQWAAVQVATVGLVSGAVTASPNIFLFGATPVPGPPIVFRAELKADKPELLKGMTATLEGEKLKGLSVKVIEGPRPAIELSVAPTAPPGPLSGRVLVKLVSGQRLTIPIQATLSAPPK